jgi:molybdopterin synthase catalytic subunit
MANPVCEVLLTEARLIAPSVDVDLSAGALVDFWGMVRELEDGREIEGIDYEAHATMAEHQMKEIARRAISDFGLHFVMVHHRIGFVSAGEASLFLRVSAKHRRAAFRANQWMVEELKKRVPIWKKPRFKIENRTRGVAGVDSRPTAAATAK